MNLYIQHTALGVPATVGSGFFGRRISAAFLLLFMVLSSANSQQPPLERDPLHVGFTRYAFRNVNPKDAEAAFLVFTYTLGRQHGYVLDTSVHVFEDLRALETEIRKRNLTVIVLDTWEYLNMEIDAEMEPAFVPKVQDVVLREHLLLTRRGNGVNRLADLRGKDIAVLNSTSSSLAISWLESLLMEQDLGTPGTFFRRLDMVTKSSQAVLPVFFGAKQACVVDRLAFETMVEMNPQTSNQLVKIAVSEPYLDSITCVSRHGYVSERAHQDLIDSLATLHQKPAGQQILTLFKANQLVPFKEEYMKSVRDLRAKLARLKESQPVQGSAASLAGTAPEAQTIKEGNTL